MEDRESGGTLSAAHAAPRLAQIHAADTDTLHTLALLPCGCRRSHARPLLCHALSHSHTLSHSPAACCAYFVLLFLATIFFSFARRARNSTRHQAQLKASASPLSVALSLSLSLSTCCVIVSVSSNRRSIRTIACLPLALGIFHCVSKFKLIFLIAPLSRYRSLPLLALSLSFSLSLALSV